MICVDCERSVSRPCPCCSDKERDVQLCISCHDEAETLYAGLYCADCLRDTINTDTALEFFEEKDYLALFMFEAHFESPVPETVSPKLKRYLREQYNREALFASFRPDSTFVKQLKQFILDGDGDTGKEVYAEWMKKHK